MEARDLDFDPGADGGAVDSGGNPDQFPKVLVLNASFEPLRIISWYRAIRLLLAQKVEVVDSYEILIHSPSLSLRLPSVLRMKRYVSKKRLTRVPRFSRQHVFLRDSHQCQYCFISYTSKELTLDHVVPVARGGKKTWSNIVTCCKVCNQKKGAQTPKEAGFAKFKYPREPSPGFLPDILYYKERMPQMWRPYLEWMNQIA
jgi:5-methylcytosine-specific restriction endonuclease McrA